MYSKNEGIFYYRNRNRNLEQGYGSGSSWVKMIRFRRFPFRFRNTGGKVPVTYLLTALVTDIYLRFSSRPSRRWPRGFPTSRARAARPPRMRRNSHPSRCSCTTGRQAFEMWAVLRSWSWSRHLQVSAPAPGRTKLVPVYFIIIHLDQDEGGDLNRYSFNNKIMKT
jgi:hypothetical protein